MVSCLNCSLPVPAILIASSLVGSEMCIRDSSYCAGQALFDVNNPTKLIGRLDKPFLQPTDDFEKSGQYPAGTVFVEGLVYYRNKWYLYYGCADSFVAVAVSDKQLNF